MRLCASFIPFLLVSFVASVSFSRPALEKISVEGDAQILRYLHGLTNYSFDWDDNIMFMPDHLGVVLFEKGSGKEVVISTEKFAEVREKVGKSGEFLNYEIIPEPRSQGSFRYFSTGANGENYFLQGLKYQLENEPEKLWKAPAFEQFIYALSNSLTASWTSIITARGHSADEIYEGLVFLKGWLAKNKGVHIHLPPVNQLHGVSHPKYKGQADSPSAIKAELMLEQLDAVSSGEYPEILPKVLNPNGSAYGDYFLWGFSDDDPGNYIKAINVLSKAVASGKYQNIKITLFYTGQQKVNYPHQVVIKSDGSLREPILGELLEASDIHMKLKGLLNCSGVFSLL